MARAYVLVMVLCLVLAGQMVTADRTAGWSGGDVRVVQPGSAGLMDRTPSDAVIQGEVSLEWGYPTEKSVYDIRADNDTVAVNHGSIIQFYDLTPTPTWNITTYGGSIYGMDMNVWKDIIVYGGTFSNLSIARLSTQRVIYEMPQYTLPDQVDDIAISPDGRYLAAGLVQNAAEEVFVYDITTPSSPSLKFKKDLGWVDALSLGFTLNDTVLVGTSGDPGGPEVRELFLDGTQRLQYDMGSDVAASVTDLCPNPKKSNEVLLLTRFDSTEARLLGLWYPSPPPQILASYDIPGSVQALTCAFSPDGGKISYSSNMGYFYIYNKTSALLLKNFTHLAPRSSPGLAWGFPGDRVFTGDSDLSSLAVMKSWRDMVSPSVSQITTTPAYYVSTLLTVSVEFSEEMVTGVGQVDVTFGTTPPYSAYTLSGSWADQTTWSGSAAIPSGTTEGVNTIRIANATDRAGNLMTPDTSRQIFVDTLPPAVTLAPQPAYWLDDPSFNLSYTIDDGSTSSGITGVSFFYRQSSDNASWTGWIPFASKTNPPLTGDVPFTFSGDGYYEFYAAATDRAGNSNAQSVMLTVGHDLTLPTAMLTSLPFYQNNRSIILAYSTSDNLQMMDLNITVQTSQDNTSWSAPVEMFNTSTTFSGTVAYAAASDGFLRFTLHASDERGNLAHANTTLVVDTQAPQTSLNHTGPYWVNGTVPITYSASDTYPLSTLAVLLRDSTDNVTWSNWSVVFSRSGGPFSGSLNLTLPSDGFYQVGMTARDAAGNINTLHPQVILGRDTRPPGVNIPAPPPYWSAGNITFQVNAQDNLGLKRLILSYRFSKDNVSFGAWTPVQTLNLSGMSWAGSLGFQVAEEGYYIVLVRAEDLAGRNASSTFAVGYDATPPTSSLTPLPLYTTRPAFNVRCSASDTLSGVSYIELWYSRDGGTPVLYGDITSGTVLFDTNATGGDGNYSFTTLSHDAAGNVEVKTSPDAHTFVDAHPPEAVMLSPSPGAVDVPVNVSIGIGFTEPVRRSLSFTLAEEGAGAAVPGLVSWGMNDTRLTFTPDAPLNRSTTYRVDITDGTDLAGNPLPAYTWRFTTLMGGAGAIISGTVRDRSTGAGIEGALVEAWRDISMVSAVSNASGVYIIPDLPEGNYEIRASAPGYISSITNVTLMDGQRLSLDIDLEPVSEGHPEDMLTFSIAGVMPVWLLMVVVVVLAVLLLVLRRRRPPPVEKKGEMAGIPGTDKKTPDRSPPPSLQKGGDETEIEKSEPDKAKDAGKGESVCPLCGARLHEDDAHCPGCKAFISTE